MSDAGETLSHLLSGVWRSPMPALRTSVEDLSAVTPVLVGSGAGPLAWWRVRHSHLRDTPPAQTLRQAYHQTSIHNALRERDLEKACSILRGVNIEPIPFKGWAIARLYPETGLRPLGDIDLHVATDLQEAAERAVTSAGGELYNVDFSHEESDMLGLSWNDIFARSEQVKLGETEIRVMGPEHHLALLCMHFLKHGGWRPLWLCDIAVALESRSPSFDWDLCLGPDRRKSHWIACTLGVAHVLLGADVDNTPVALQAERLPHWLVPAVLRAWERPRLVEHAAPELIATSLRDPRSLRRAVQARWLNPIEGTVRLGGAFNELPRLPYQIAGYALRIQHFATRLEKLVSGR